MSISWLAVYKARALSFHRHRVHPVGSTPSALLFTRFLPTARLARLAQKPLNHRGGVGGEWIAITQSSQIRRNLIRLLLSDVLAAVGGIRIGRPVAIIAVALQTSSVRTVTAGIAVSADSFTVAEVAG